MNNVIIATHAVLPTLIILLVGYLLKRINVLKIDYTNGLNKAITNLFLPCLTCTNVLNLNTEEMKDYKLILFSIGVMTFVFIFGNFLNKILDKDRKTSVSSLITIVNTNAIILGGSIAVSLYGTLPPIIGFATSVTATMMNVYALCSIELYKTKKMSLKTLVEVFKKPLVFAVVLAFIIKLSGVVVPDVILETVTTLGRATMPVSLISLGIFFNFGRLSYKLSALIKTMIFRYILAIFAICLAVYFGFRNERLSAIMFIFMAPAAVASYPFATEYNLDSELVGNILIISTIFSVLVFSITIYILKSMALI